MKPSDFDVIGVECDVSSEHSVQKAYQETMERFGRIDSVVASAGQRSFNLCVMVLIIVVGIVENYSAFE